MSNEFRQYITVWLNEWKDLKDIKTLYSNLVINLTCPNALFQHRVLSHKYIRHPELNLQQDIILQLFTWCLKEATQLPTCTTYISHDKDILPSFPLINHSIILPYIILWLTDVKNPLIDTFITISSSESVINSICNNIKPIVIYDFNYFLCFCHSRKLQLTTEIGLYQLLKWKQYTSFDSIAIKLKVLRPDLIE